MIMARISYLALPAVLMLGAACRDSQAPSPVNPAELAALIVSNPRSSAFAADAAEVNGALVTELVYSSLPPGSVPDGKQITIRNLRTGTVVTEFMAEGGLDPVPLPATVGDTLLFRIERAGNAAELEFIALVPLWRPPVIVRTSPPPGRRDVPLNARIILVFSEPINPATLTSGSVTLVSNGGAVSGTLTFEDPANLIVSFTPLQPLASSRTHSLTISQAIEDLGGDPLPAPVTVTFTTSDAGPQGADVSGIYLASASGSGAQWLVRGTWPAWSPDGQQIAFEQDSAIYTINVNGSGTKRLTGGTQPSWSPDGSMIAFATRSGISVIRADGTQELELVGGNFDPSVTDPIGLGKPSWSPDGARIAFEHYGNGDLPGQIYVMSSRGRTPRRLTAPYGMQFAESDPSWSADGSRVLFWSYGYGVAFADPSLVTVNSVYQNFPFSAYGTRPDQSSSSGAILFTGYGDPLNGGSGSFSLYVMTSSGTGIHRLIDQARQGTYSPDGARIAFVRAPPESHNIVLKQVSITGSRMHGGSRNQKGQCTRRAMNDCRLLGPCSETRGSQPPN